MNVNHSLAFEQPPCIATKKCNQAKKYQIMSPQVRRIECGLDTLKNGSFHADRDKALQKSECFALTNMGTDRTRRKVHFRSFLGKAKRPVMANVGNFLNFRAKKYG